MTKTPPKCLKIGSQLLNICSKIFKTFIQIFPKWEILVQKNLTFNQQCLKLCSEWLKNDPKRQKHRPQLSKNCSKWKKRQTKPLKKCPKWLINSQTFVLNDKYMSKIITKRVLHNSCEWQENVQSDSIMAQNNNILSKTTQNVLILSKMIQNLSEMNEMCSKVLKICSKCRQNDPKMI